MNTCGAFVREFMIPDWSQLSQVKSVCVNWKKAMDRKRVCLKIIVSECASAAASAESVEKKPSSVF